MASDVPAHAPFWLREAHGQHIIGNQVMSPPQIPQGMLGTTADSLPPHDSNLRSVSLSRSLSRSLSLSLALSRSVGTQWRGRPVAGHVPAHAPLWPREVHGRQRRLRSGLAVSTFDTES